MPESSTVDRNTEAESASKKPKESEDMKKQKLSISKIRCSRKTPKNFTETWTLRI
jgi:hypothetical protein